MYACMYTYIQNSTCMYTRDLVCGEGASKSTLLKTRKSDANSLILADYDDLNILPSVK